MPGHRVGVTSRLPILHIGTGRLRDEGPKTQILCVIAECVELLVDDRQFAPQIPQTIGRLTEFPLDQSLSE